MPIAYCLLPIAYCLLPFAYCLLPILLNHRCLLFPIILPIACCLLPDSVMPRQRYAFPALCLAATGGCLPKITTCPRNRKID